MAASVNGWRVITRAECTDVHVPGGILPVHPEFATLAWDCAHLWHETVEPLLWPGCWGWAKPTESGRDPATTGFVTNHSSGTAWDLCAPRHPRGVPLERTFTAAQLRAIERMESRYFGVLRWGGRWSGPQVDGMHWEGAPGVTVEAVRDLTEMIRAENEPPPPPPSPSAPPSSPPAPAGRGWSGPDLTGSGLLLRGNHGDNGPRVAALQAWLARTYPAYRHKLGGALIAADGRWGDQTTAWVRTFAHRSGVRSADGRNIGPQIARRLHGAGCRP